MSTATQRDTAFMSSLSTITHMQCIGHLEKATSTGMEINYDTGSHTYKMSTCKQDKLVSSGICTHPGPHSVVDSLPGGECSGLHHENQHVDQRPAEPIDRHETCTATYPFVVKILQAYVADCHGWQQPPTTHCQQSYRGSKKEQQQGCRHDVHEND